MPTQRLHHLLNVHPRFNFIHNRLSHFQTKKRLSQCSRSESPEGGAIRHGHQPSQHRRQKPLKFLM